MGRISEKTHKQFEGMRKHLKRIEKTLFLTGKSFDNFLATFLLRRQRSEQYTTVSQLFLHAFLHWKGRKQMGQILLGNPDFTRPPARGACQLRNQSDRIEQLPMET